ncbi:MAG: PDZ domain-containing protein [Christensenellales bacterium]
MESVSQGSAAQEGGLLAGDIILAVDGQAVTDNLSELLARQAGGIPRQFYCFAWGQLTDKRSSRLM